MLVYYLMENTRDLMDFGRRELSLAARLLSLLGSEKDITFRLSEKVTPELNPDSGYVFLISDNFSVAMVNSKGFLEDWVMCDCGAEGFISELEKSTSPCCKTYAKAG